MVGPGELSHHYNNYIKGKGDTDAAKVYPNSLNIYNIVFETFQLNRDTLLLYLEVLLHFNLQSKSLL